jgi:SAM-dependent methyltransferase
MSHEPQPTTINQLAYGVFPSFAMLAGMQLDLFSELAHGAATCEQLAVRLGVGAQRLLPLLDVLATTGLLVREGAAFDNGAEAQRFLVKGQPDYRGGFAGFYESLWRTALSSAESIRSGAPVARIDFGSLDHDALIAFFRRQYPSSLAAGRELAHTVDFARFTDVADVGGGTGGTSIGVCMTQPSLRSTVYDLPSVTPIAELFIAEAGLSDRIAVVSADMTGAPQRASHDIAVVRSVLQVLNAQAARAVISNAHALLRPGGELILVGSVLNDSRTGPASALARGMVFLNVYDHGQSYTEAEHFGWLREAGFVDLRIEYASQTDGSSMIRARRP